MAVQQVGRELRNVPQGPPRGGVQSVAGPAGDVPAAVLGQCERQVEDQAALGGGSWSAFGAEHLPGTVHEGMDLGDGPAVAGGDGAPGQS